MSLDQVDLECLLLDRFAAAQAKAREKPDDGEVIDLSGEIFAAAQREKPDDGGVADLSGEVD